LIDGTLVEKPMGYWESVVAAAVSEYLRAHVRSNSLGVVSGGDGPMRMKMGRVRLPDVAFVSKARVPNNREAILSVAPDLAVEVLSESNTRREIDQKLREYFQSGTRLAWIIDPEPRTAAIYHHPDLPTRIINEKDLLVGEQVVPGFTVQLSRIFEDVPRN
jgi:Uma2 family endonuclease